MTAVAPGRLRPPYDRWGRYQIWPDNKNAKRPVGMTRVTTLASTLSDKFNLEQWKLRTAIRGLAANTDLYRQAKKHADRQDKLNEIARDAVAAGDTKKAAERGTALHSYAELVDLGHDIDTLPDIDPYQGHDVADLMVAYRDGLQTHGIRVLPDHLERVCVNRHVEAAGTYDRLVEWNGRTVVADLKTGGYLNELEIAIQLACYANCTSLYDVDDDWIGHHHTPPPIDLTVGLILHLPQDDPEPQLEVLTVDLKAGWDAALLAYQVREWRRRNLTAKVEAGVPSRRDLERRIATIKTIPDALAMLPHYWPAGIPTFKQSDQQTAADYQAIANAIGRLEADFEVPF